MKKKSAKSVKSKQKPLYNLLPKNEIEYQQRLIAASERCIGPHGTDLDLFFRNQADRQRKRLEELMSKK